MKKVIYCLVILVLFITGCKKNNLNIDEFIDVAKFNGYIINNTKSGYESYVNVLDVYYAINREDAYKVQFLKLNTELYAKQFFLLNVNEIKNNITNKDYVKSNSSSYYEYYHAENDSSYYLVIRSNENILYIVAPIGYINEIEEFLDELSIDY